jgi:hypothetical protein
MCEMPAGVLRFDEQLITVKPGHSTATALAGLAGYGYPSASSFLTLSKLSSCESGLAPSSAIGTKAISAQETSL